MSNDDQNGAGEESTSARAEFETVLDRFGGDPRRWPEALRGRMTALAASDAAAAARLRQEQALDRVLGLAPLPDGARQQALVARIMALATQDRPEGKTAAIVPSAVVVALPPRRGSRPAMLPWTTREMLQGATMMAACMLFGLYLGASGPLAPVLQEVADSLGIATDVDRGIYYVASDESVGEEW